MMPAMFYGEHWRHHKQSIFAFPLFARAHLREGRCADSLAWGHRVVRCGRGVVSPFRLSRGDL